MLLNQILFSISSVNFPFFRLEMRVWRSNLMLGGGGGGGGLQRRITISYSLKCIFPSNNYAFKLQMHMTK